jgi:hypothetical protein
MLWWYAKSSLLIWSHPRDLPLLILSSLSKTLVEELRLLECYAAWLL